MPEKHTNQTKLSYFNSKTSNYYSKNQLNCSKRPSKTIKTFRGAFAMELNSIKTDATKAPIGVRAGISPLSKILKKMFVAGKKVYRKHSSV